MKRKLTALFIALLLSLALLGSAVAAPYYSDTADLQPWAAEAVDFMTKYGLMNGVSGGKFDPNGYANRAMVATLIWRLAGEPIGNLTGVFADVPLEQWYSDAIDWAAEEKIVTGSYGHFYPFDYVTRQDLVLILYRYAGSPVTDVTVLSYFRDFTEVSGYAANALAWAVEQGIILGSDDGSLLPRESATRAQLAAILTRYLKLNPEQIPEQVIPDPLPEPDPEEPAPEAPEQGELTDEIPMDTVPNGSETSDPVAAPGESEPPAEDESPAQSDQTE